MLTYLALSLTMLFATGNTSAAQLDAVVAAISKGDAKTVGTYFDQTVELVLPGHENIYSKSQAEQLLGKFFTANAVKGFSRVHGGQSRGADGAYVIGTLSTANGNFRIYVYGRGDTRPIVQELRVEAE